MIDHLEVTVGSIMNVNSAEIVSQSLAAPLLGWQVSMKAAIAKYMELAFCLRSLLVKKLV